ncbi:hypothetical protein AX018_1001146 [Paracidovorax anthurii]|uniref:Fe-S oxidoreductase n=1 Tax=Paracidovorax anthurii TaxID=78229 RepID=A0A328ZL12_9BURK|nr:Fe-S oxidoreductase [Paracidovorax anthurii]RAR86559.1 hypothetical protein AX018_1001146 [Paracidovorax anthurii]
MPSSIDPPRPPLAPLARLMAEAALQRQNMLLGTDRDRTAPAPATPSALPLPTPATPPAERVSVSPEARARADAAAAGLPPGSRGPGAAVAGPGGRGASPGGQAPASPGAGGVAAPVSAPGAAPVAGAAGAWPAGGVAGPMRALLGMLAHQLAGAGGGLRVVAAQPWTAEQAQALRAGAALQGPAAALQTWLVGQGSVHAEDGERGFSFTLQAPAAWLQRGAAVPPPAGGGTAPMPAGAGAGAALTVPLPGRTAQLESGVFALVLQGRDGAGAGGVRGSALLSLEFQPPPPPGLYGREWLVPVARTDPWLQMAALQASGYRREDEEAEAAARRGGVPLCDVQGCPYADRAPCEQPFCMALRVMAPQRSAGA